MTSQNRQLKEKEVEKLEKQLAKTKSVVLVDFAGMNVKAQQELKNRLKAAGASMNVVKNTLFRLAANKASLPKGVAEDEVLSGQTAAIISEEDPVSPIQVLGKFLSEFELPSLKVGVVEGEFTDKDGLLTLSKLPGRDVLAGQVVGAIAAPMYGFVGVLNANMQKLIYILKQKSQGGE